MTREELHKNGVNTSITHVDFMVGSKEMNIDGITKTENGNHLSEMATGQLNFSNKFHETFNQNTRI